MPARPALGARSGPCRSNLEKTGPVTSGLTLTPNPSSGSVTVALHATGNDTQPADRTSRRPSTPSTRGASGSDDPRWRSTRAPSASLDATIAAGLAAERHPVSVHSQDALGNWGACRRRSRSTWLPAARSRPLSARTKNPNNGALPLNASQPVVRVTATMTSTGIHRQRRRGLHRYGRQPPARGFPFVPSDGALERRDRDRYRRHPAGDHQCAAGGQPHHLRARQGRGGQLGSLTDTVATWPAAARSPLIDKTAPRSPASRWRRPRPMAPPA